MLDPRSAGMPGKYVVTFDQWSIYTNWLYLSIRYTSSVPGQYGWTPQSGASFQFAARAPDVTSPIVFWPKAMMVCDGPVFFQGGVKYPASVEIVTNPDVPTTWGGPLVKVQIEVPDTFDFFEFTVRLPTNTEATHLDGHIKRL